MRTILISLLSVFLFTGSLFAQQNYVWEYYGISFTLADDFMEVVNDSEEFSASGDGMDLTIIPFTDETINDSDIISYTVEIAASLNLNRIDDINTITFNGFSGGYAEGELGGDKIFLMGVIDPESATNFFVMISFLDGDENAIEEAINICKSIRKL